MASTYTPLGIELQATGENAGTWGTKTNTNLSIIEQISGGYSAQSIAGGAQTTALSVSDGSTGAVMSHRMIEFTGSITGNQIVTIPLDVQNFYFLRNSTSGAYTVQFKYASGSGDTFTFSATDKGDQLVFATADDGTNPDIYSLSFGDVTLTGTQTLTNKTLTSPKIGTSILDTNGNELALLTATGSAVNEFTIANAATGNDPTLSATGGDSNIDIAIKPKGTGETVFGTGAANATITSSGAHDLILDTNSGTNSGTITITDAANGDITIAPNGTGVAKAVDAGDNTGAIKIAGKEYPQNLLTALKRINRKALKKINHTIKSLQIKQKVKQGYAYTKKRFATVPLWLDIDFLIELDKTFEKGEVWHIEYDENNLPIKKILTSRHPYRAELQKLKTMAILKKQF